MRRSTKNVIAGIAVIGCLAAANTKRQSFDCQAVADGDIVGRLGEPLGTICRIEGVAVAADPMSKGTDPADVWLRIDSVDGKKVTPLYYNAAIVMGKTKLPKVGDAIKCEVYESGSFIGSLADPNGPKAERLDIAVQTNDRNFGRYHLVESLHLYDREKKQ